MARHVDDDFEMHLKFVEDKNGKFRIFNYACISS